MAIQAINQLAAPNQNRLGTVGLKLFFALAEQWGLSQEQQLTLLGQNSRTTLRNWREKIAAGETVRLSADTLERLSLIAGIRKGVEMLYPENRWNDYMRSANTAFGGETPLDRMLHGRVGNLYEVRRYLDGSRGAHFG